MDSGLGKPNLYDYYRAQAQYPNMGPRYVANQDLSNTSGLHQSTLDIPGTRAHRNEVLANNFLLNQPINSQTIKNLDWRNHYQSDGNAASADHQQSMIDPRFNGQPPIAANQLLMNQHFGNQRHIDPRPITPNDTRLDAEIAPALSLPRNGSMALNGGRNGGGLENSAKKSKQTAPKKKPISKKRESAVANPLSVPRIADPVLTATQRRTRDYSGNRNTIQMDEHSRINDHQFWDDQERDLSEEDEDEEYPEGYEPEYNPARVDIPEGMAMTARGQLVQANGRVKGRKLVLWHRPRMMEKLILHLQYELHRRGMDIPWNNIVHRMSPGSTGQTATQNLAKLRDILIREGHLVPPLCGKVSNPQDPHIRGYVRDMKSADPTATRAVFWDEDVPDRKESLSEPGLTRGSGNYRKTEGGQVLNETTKAQPAAQRGPLPSDVLHEQATKLPESRKRPVSPDNLEMGSEPKRSRSGRILRSSAKVMANNEQREVPLMPPNYEQAQHLSMSHPPSLPTNHNDQGQPLKFDEALGWRNGYQIDNTLNHSGMTSAPGQPIYGSGSLGLGQNHQYVSRNFAPSNVGAAAHNNGGLVAGGNNMFRPYQQNPQGSTALRTDQYVAPASFVKLDSEGYANGLPYSNIGGRAQEQMRNLQRSANNSAMQRPAPYMQPTTSMQPTPSMQPTQSMQSTLSMKSTPSAKSAPFEQSAPPMQSYGGNSGNFGPQRGSGTLQPRMQQAQPMSMVSNSVGYHNLDVPFGFAPNVPNASSAFAQMNQNSGAYGASINPSLAPTATTALSASAPLNQSNAYVASVNPSLAPIAPLNQSSAYVASVNPSSAPNATSASSAFAPLDQNSVSGASINPLSIPEDQFSISEAQFSQDLFAASPVENGNGDFGNGQEHENSAGELLDQADWINQGANENQFGDQADENLFANQSDFDYNASWLDPQLSLSNAGYGL